MKNRYIASLLESDLDQAEVVLAAKSLSDELQSIIERLAKLQVNELMPLTDRIKETIGPMEADNFEQTVSQQLDVMLDTAKQTKNTIEDQVLTLNGEAPMGGDMGMGVPGQMDPMADMGVDPGMEEPVDDFGGAEGMQGEEEPLGRSVRESRKLHLQASIKQLQEAINKFKAK